MTFDNELICSSEVVFSEGCMGAHAKTKPVSRATDQCTILIVIVWASPIPTALLPAASVSLRWNEPIKLAFKGEQTFLRGQPG